MAEQQQLFRHGAWYEAAKPALFTNKTIREWLSVYSECQRPDAFKLVLLHGILCLRKTFGQQTLTVQKLAEITAHGAPGMVLAEGLKPDVQQMQQVLGNCTEQFVAAETVEL